MHPSQQTDIYSPSAVKELFNEMSTTYGVVNMIASLGFTIIWRKYVIAKLDRTRAPGVMVDLMSGMGELFSIIRSDLKPPEKLIGIDFSTKMCEQAKVEAGFQKLFADFDPELNPSIVPTFNNRLTHL